AGCATSGAAWGVLAEPAQDCGWGRTWPAMAGGRVPVSQPVCGIRDWSVTGVRWWAAASFGNVIHGAPVVPPAALAELPRGRLVASVAGEAARSEIRAFLAALSWVETRDFVCAA